jgi:hypothetical protein
MWGRKARGGGPRQEEHVIAIQTRHGQPKTAARLKSAKPCQVSKEDGAATAPLSISVSGGRGGDHPVVVSEAEKLGRSSTKRAGDTFVEVDAESLCDPAIVWVVDSLSVGAARVTEHE